MHSEFQALWLDLTRRATYSLVLSACAIVQGQRKPSSRALLCDEPGWQRQVDRQGGLPASCNDPIEIELDANEPSEASGMWITAGPPGERLKLTLLLVRNGKVEGEPFDFTLEPNQQGDFNVTVVRAR